MIEGVLAVVTGAIVGVAIFGAGIGVGRDYHKKDETE